MKSHWHEQIQRYANGQSSAEEAAALEAALNEDAELRALYLDYMNLDVALSAAAEAATITEIKIGKANSFPRPSARWSSHPWRWVAAAAACAALIVFAMLPRHHDPSPSRPDIAATISSTQGAIARLSVEPPSLFPEWVSVTDSMLDQLRIPQ
jgi:hypothetical protein